MRAMLSHIRRSFDAVPLGVFAVVAAVAVLAVGLVSCFVRLLG